MTTLVQCTGCSAAVPSGRFCAVCGAKLLPGAETVTVAAPAAGFSQPVDLLTEPDVPTPAAGPHLAASVLPTQAIPSHDVVDDSVERAGLVSLVHGWKAPGAVLAVGAAVAVGVIVAIPDEHTVTGSMTVIDGEFLFAETGEDCENPPGFDDIHQGSQVIVKDEAGTTMSTSELGSGRIDGLGCTFDFTLEGVGDAKFYSVELGRDARGELSYSYDEMVESNWSVDLVLGD